MSEFRRKLLFKNSSSDRWIEIARITQTGKQTVTIPTDYSRYGFFIVGGGGGGSGDTYRYGRSGNGGNGGQVKSFIVDKQNGVKTITVIVGNGGNGGGSEMDTTNARNGGTSSVVYGEMAYYADGGYRGSHNGMDAVNTKQDNSGIGGQHVFVDYYSPTSREWVISHNATESKIINGITFYGGKGENGIKNPFDKFDVNLYGAGGNGAFGAIGHNYDKFPGATTGGGTSGYGPNNKPTNKGENGTFYGAGGGGGSFSSSHTYSTGGNGYNGIVIIYGKK